MFCHLYFCSFKIHAYIKLNGFEIFTELLIYNFKQRMLYSTFIFDVLICALILIMNLSTNSPPFKIIKKNETTKIKIRLSATCRPGTYNIFKHNCNSFSNEVSHFLVGQGIPKYILDLPEEIIQT